MRIAIWRKIDMRVESRISGNDGGGKRQSLDELDNLDHFGTVGRYHEGADRGLPCRRERMQRRCTPGLVSS